jgi:hypothetical protein
LKALVLSLQKGNFPPFIFFSHCPSISIGNSIQEPLYRGGGVNALSLFPSFSLFPAASIGKPEYPFGCILKCWEML